jgi:hypothetical protein
MEAIGGILLAAVLFAALVALCVGLGRAAGWLFERMR